MINITNKLFGILSLVLALASCSDELEVAVAPDEDNWEYVEIPLSVVPADEPLLGDGTSRSVIDSDAAKCDIRDLWVLQYDGTGDDAILIGKQQYFGPDDLSAEGTDHDLEKRVKAKFVISERTCRIVVLANTLEPGLTFTKYSTIADLKERTRDSKGKLSKIFSLDATNEDATEDFPDDFDYYIEMNGYTDLVTDGTQTPDCIKLERNLARIDFTLKIKNDVDGNPIVALSSVPQLCDAQRYTNYFTNYPHADNYQSSVTYLNDLDPCPAEDPTVEYGYTVYQYRYYCAPNYRGTVESVKEAKDKNTYAPKGATYIRIPAKCTDDGSTIPACYTVYLGANHTTDYNLKANYCYAFTLTLNSTGDATSDSRVEKWPDVDFRDYTERSNCYILNPPLGNGQTRSFKVPIDRIDAYWGSPNYGNTEHNTLNDLNEWRAFVVWADFDYNGKAPDGVTDAFQLTTSTGKGCYQNVDGKKVYQYFEVKVAAGVCGNIVVAVGSKGTNILWSWHLWITDYDPDRAFRTGISPVEGKYVYSVPGGQIHRYGGPDWETDGELEKSFIMDRYLGAFSPNRVDQGGTWESPDFTFPKGGGLLYQYGRKDPTYYPACDGSCYSSTGLYFGTDGNGTKYRMDVQSSITTSESWISTGVYSPTMVLKNENDFKNNWFNETGKNLTRDFWLDPINLTTDNIKGKSIFDPSPLGWRVPYARYTNTEGYDTFYPWYDFDSNWLYLYKDPDTGDEKPYVFYYKTNQGYYVNGGSITASTLGKGKQATVFSPYMINPETETYSYGIYGSMLYWPKAETENINTDIIYPVYRYNKDNNIGWVWTSGPYRGYYNVESHTMSLSNAGGYNAFVRCVRDLPEN